MKRLVVLLAVSLLSGLFCSPFSQASTAKTDFPIKGRTISLIVPFAAGGGTDVAARLLGNLMEKDLGVQVMIVNKPGAGSQVGVTALATAKPDGYTIGVTPFPHIMTCYLDPQRQAVFSRASFEPVGAFMVNPVISSVAAGSPHKSLKDVLEAAKANPGTIKAGTTGILGPSHLGLLQLQKVTGVKFAVVHFDGGAPQMTALLGGHIDLASNITPEVMGPSRAGQIRVLGVMDKRESPFLRGVPTLESQGYPVVATSPVGISAPAGTPKEIVAILAASMKKAVATADWKSKMEELGFTTMEPDPGEYSVFWQETETQIKPLMDLAKHEAGNR